MNPSYHIRRKREDKGGVANERAVPSSHFLFYQDQRLRCVAGGERSDGEKERRGKNTLSKKQGMAWGWLQKKLRKKKKDAAERSIKYDKTWG